jgi:hypothetical protein
MKSAVMPSRRAIEDLTLARLRVSPSMAAVEIASPDQTSLSTSAKSVAPIASALPNRRPTSLRALFSDCARRSGWKVSSGQVGAFQIQEVLDISHQNVRRNVFAASVEAYGSLLRFI